MLPYRRCRPPLESKVLSLHKTQGGSDAAKLAPVLAAANQLTAFTSGGASFTLYVSPLLPDEVAP